METDGAAPCIAAPFIICASMTPKLFACAAVLVLGIACGGDPPTAATGSDPATASPGTASGPFRHPGVLVNRTQLDFVKAKIQAGAQPWKAAYDKARADAHGSLSYTPRPRAVVECGPSSNPNLGCTDERGDAQAAYTHALLWYFTGSSAHAGKSVDIMNAWARTITAHTNHNAPLQTGWAGSMWAPAAEIITHTGAGWPAADVNAFKDMLRRAYVPEIQNGSCANGNWELIMTNALFGIAVFLDDQALFDKAIALWRGRVPAYIYQTTDGPSPVKPGHCSLPSWYGQTVFVDGVGQETCRDFGHMEWGVMAAVDGAETALQQGRDLYAEQSKRLRDALEFHAAYNLGAPVPPWLCGGSVQRATTPAWEIAYNHFANRRGFSLPNSKRMIEERVRPTGINYFIAWETLTHGEVGTAGLP
jgi:alginate lyase